MTVSADAGAAQASQRQAASEKRHRIVHGGLQSNLPYASSTSSQTLQSKPKRMCENLLMNGEFPVEHTTTKIFFVEDRA